MTVTQPSLFDQPSMPTDQDACRLINYLLGANDWRTRADIERDLGFNDRRVRLARHEAGRVLISCTKGFRHLLAASPGDRREAINFYRRQGRDMFETSDEIEDACRELGCEILGMEAVQL